jgi:glycosyltransferase involved in cell wall biosynthesis
VSGPAGGGVAVSVVTVVRNGAATIGDCLASVAAQSHAAEQIVIDGASTDGTAGLVRAFRPPVARLVSEPDGGIYEAMNKGILLAGGEVVGTLNADDVYADAAVLAQVAAAFADPELELVYGDLEYVDRADPGRVVRRWRAGAFTPRSFYRGWMPPHPTVFVRRQVYERCGLFATDLGTAADYELLLRLLLRHRVRAAYLPRVLVRMRRGGASNRTLGARLRAHQMDRRAWEVNGLRPLPWTLPLKPLRKLGQYLR